MPHPEFTAAKPTQRVQAAVGVYTNICAQARGGYDHSAF